VAAIKYKIVAEGEDMDKTKDFKGGEIDAGI